LLAGASQFSRGVQSPTFSFLYSDDRSKWPQVEDDYWHSAAHHDAATIAIVWNGNQHNAHFLLKGSPSIRIAGLKDSAEDKFLAESEVVVSQATFEELWKPDWLALQEALKVLSARKHCFVVGTPPPKDKSEIREHLSRDPFFVQRAAELGMPVDNLPVTSNAFRVFLWQQIQRGLENVAEQMNATFVPVPGSCLNELSLLNREYGAPDATHANGLYGEQMLRAISNAWRDHQ